MFKLQCGCIGVMLGPDEFFTIRPCDPDSELVGRCGYNVAGMTPCTVADIRALSEYQSLLVKVWRTAAEVKHQKGRLNTLVKHLNKASH